MNTYEVIESDGEFFVRCTDETGNRGVTRVFPTLPYYQTHGYTIEEVLEECDIAESNIVECGPDMMTIAKEDDRYNAE